MNILIVGHFSSFSLEKIYYDELLKINASTYKFDLNNFIFSHETRLNRAIARLFSADFDYIKSETEILGTIKNKSINVVLIFKGYFIRPSLLIEIKNNNCLLINYNPDHPTKYFSIGSGNSNILSSIIFFDIYLTFTATIKQEIQNQYGVCSYVIPFGFKFQKEIYSHLNSPRDSYTEKLLFLGEFDTTRKIQIGQLLDKGIEINIVGSEKWKRHFRNNYLGTGYNSDDVCYFNSSHLASINFLRRQNLITNSHNMRTFEVPGSHGLLISQYTDEQNSFFEQDKEAFYFETIDEAVLKMKFIINNKSLAKKVRLQGYKRAIKSNYAYEYRAKSMFDIIKKNN